MSDWILESLESGSYVVDPVLYEGTLRRHAQQVERYRRRVCESARLRIYCVR